MNQKKNIQKMRNESKMILGIKPKLVLENFYSIKFCTLCHIESEIDCTTNAYVGILFARVFLSNRWPGDAGMSNGYREV